MTDERNTTGEDSGNTSAGDPENGTEKKGKETEASCCSGSMNDRMMGMMGKMEGLKGMMSMCREMMIEMGAGCCPSGAESEGKGENAR